jgi:hypothetical protein
MSDLTTHPLRAGPLWVTLALLVTLLWGGARAQTLGFALSYGAALEPEVQLRDLSAGPVGLDLRVAGGLGSPLEAGVAARFRSSFGPLGTLSVTGRADADTAGAFDLGVDGSGALAATGVEASLSVFNRNRGAFAPTAAYTLDSRPFFPGGVGAYLEVGAIQRLGRTLILEATPLAQLPGGYGGWGGARGPTATASPF